MSHLHYRATALAHSNIALAKYWGKASVEQNLPAVPSLSLTLEGLNSRTTVAFDAALPEDHVVLDGLELSGRALQRASALLDAIRQLAGLGWHARVDAENDFPTAAGLASSASGFAALVVASAGAAGLALSAGQLSALARQASASAARSLFGGFVALRAGSDAAEPVASAEHWSLSMVVAIVGAGPKATGSTEGMLHTAATSPYYAAWVDSAPGLFDAVHAAVLNRDLAALGQSMEQSTLMMHASMLAARPALAYLTPSSWAVIEQVYRLRKFGIEAYFTMDAGSHVKVLTERHTEQKVLEALVAVPGVDRVLVCRPGRGARLLEPDPHESARTG